MVECQKYFNFIVFSWRLLIVSLCCLVEAVDCRLKVVFQEMKELGDKFTDFS
jgi:hypothetical protein